MKRLFLAILLICHIAIPCRAKSVPILMYHDFSNEYTGDFVISEARFTEHLSALASAGYTAVSFGDLINYVYYGIPLPEKPIIITSDDGYTGVVEIAAPCAAKFGMKLTCAVIGCSACGTAAGHFSLDSPIPDNVEVVSHTYDLHENINNCDGVLNPYVGSAEYESQLVADCAIMKQSFAEQFPYTASVLVYPHGSYSSESERIFRSLGYIVTVTCDRGIADVRENVPQSLCRLPRISVWNTTTAEKLLYLVSH